MEVLPVFGQFDKRCDELKEREKILNEEYYENLASIIHYAHCKEKYIKKGPCAYDNLFMIKFTFYIHLLHL